MIHKIYNIFRHPKVFYARLSAILRNMKYPECSRTALIFNPIRVTLKYLHLGDKVIIYNNARIECICEYSGIKYSPSIYIGSGTTIQQNSHITCAGELKIGKSCAITHNVTITDIDHSYEYAPDCSTPPYATL